MSIPSISPFSLPDNPYTLWNNPLTQQTSFFKVVASLFPDLNQEPSLKQLNRWVFRPLGRLCANFFERLFDTTALFRSFEGVDSFSKFLKVVISTSKLFLGETHSFIVAIKGADKALSGLIFSKHFIDLSENKYKDFFASEKKAKIVSTYLIQAGHFCSMLEYLKSRGVFDWINASGLGQTMGQIPLLRVACRLFDRAPLGKTKDLLVAIGSIVALIAILESLVVKRVEYINGPKEAVNHPEIKRARQLQGFEGFIGAMSDREADGFVSNWVNGLLKAWTAAAAVGWLSKGGIAFTMADFLLGWTALHKEMGAVLDKDQERQKAGARMVYFFGKPHPSEVGNYKINVVTSEALPEAVFTSAF